MLQNIRQRKFVFLPDGEGYESKDTLQTETEMGELISEVEQIDDNHFKCAMCGGVFEKELTDEEAMGEYIKVWGKPLKEEDSVSVCNDCWQEMKPVIFN